VGRFARSSRHATLCGATARGCVVPPGYWAARPCGEARLQVYLHSRPLQPSGKNLAGQKCRSGIRYRLRASAIVVVVREIKRACRTSAKRLRAHTAVTARHGACAGERSSVADRVQQQEGKRREVTCNCGPH
jgi:hypothetical protein